MLKLLRLNEPRAHMALMMGVFTAIGVTLLLQPARFANTPSYANLLAVLPAWAWGAIYLVTAVLNVWSILDYKARVLVVVTHTVGISLGAAWWAAFIVRYATDNGTTIVNPVSWTVFLYLMIRSAMMLDDHVDGPEIRR
jgi:hypothetical protein